MAQVGDALRAARESRGLTLEQVEKATRIRRVFLEAIEEDRFDELPAPVYARGFIRNYARLVGLDPDDIVAAYATATGTPPPGRAHQVLDEPLVQRAGGSPVVGVLWGILIVLVIAGVAWYAYVRFYLGETPTLPALPSLPILAPRGSSLAKTPEPSSQAVVVVPAPTEVVEPTDVPPTPEPSPTAVPTERPATTPTPSKVVMTPTASPTAALPTATPPESTQVQATGVTVDATVTAATYVEVTADGVRLLTTTLQAGDDRTWAGDRSVALRVGNAGGIVLKVNGVEVPPLGANGQVVNVEYTLDNLPQG